MVALVTGGQGKEPMIDVLFFAKLREELGVDQISVEYRPAITTVASLQQALMGQFGTHWQSILDADNIICAVNQQVVELSDEVCDGDEVAFFPPVTGG